MIARDRIGIDVNTKLPIEEAVGWAKRSGVKVIDVNLDVVPELLQGDPARAARARRVIDEAGITLGLHTLSAVNIAETSPVVSEAVDRYLEAYIERGKELGAGWIIVHAGYHFTGDYKQRRAASLERLKRAAAKAEKAGMTLLLENMNKEPADAEVRYLGFDLEECQFYFGALESTSLRWSFTVNHAHLVPEGIDGFLDALDLKRCDEVRLADCKGDKEEHLRPGEGTIDFARMFRRIEAMGYRGHYMNAFGSLDDMLAGREYFLRASG
jgi:sugar phosphate isomerase/epimerase